MARTKSSVMGRPFVGTGGQESGDSMEIDVDELGSVSEADQVKLKKKEVSDEVLRARQGASAGSLMDTPLAEETQRRLHLGEAQGSGSRWLNKVCALIIM